MENLTIQTKYDPKFWDEHFGIDNADPHRYATENLRLIDIRGGVRVSNFQSAVPIQPASTNLSVTHDLISSFIDFKCENISNRYLYREPLRKFLAAASIEALGHYTSHPTSKTQRWVEISSDDAHILCSQCSEISLWFSQYVTFSVLRWNLMYFFCLTLD